MFKKIIILGIFLLLISVCGCGNNAIGQATGYADQFSIITLSSDSFFSAEECAKRGLNDKVMMLESKYCGHCKKTQPLFQQSCEEKGINPIILDVSVDEQRRQMESYGIDIRYTPTFVFGCDYYIGAKEKEEYSALLDEFLSKG